MKTRATSLLLPAVLVLVVVSLAVWVVSQLTGGQAAAERLPMIVVGLSASESKGESAAQSDSDSAAQSDSSSAVGSTSSTSASTGIMSTTSVGSDLSVGSKTTADTLGGATTTATSNPGESTAPRTGTRRGTASPGSRMVVPDPLRERVREHDGGIMSTTGATAPGTTTSTTVTPTSGSASGMMGTTGPMGH